MTATYEVPIPDDRERIERLLSDSETPEDYGFGQTFLRSAWKPNEPEKFWLLKTLGDRPSLFKSVVQWGEPEQMSARAFKLLKYLIDKEKFESQYSDGGHVESTRAVQSDYCQVAQNLLVHVSEVMDLDTTDEHGGNILHVVCESGTRNMTEVVIGALERRGLLEDFLEAPNDSGQRPTTLVVGGKDIDLLELLALYDDNKRQDHVHEAVKKGSLPFLEVLLRDRPDLDELLSEGIYMEAAKVGNLPVWEFLARTDPARARLHQNLRTAVIHRRVDIVRHMLANYPDVLECQEELLETTTKAVKLSKGTEPRGIRTGTSRVHWQANDRALSVEIEELLLDKMVRSLDPGVVQACWPRDKGRAANEVTLELDLRSPLRWTWFCQIVKTAEQEVRAWKERDQAAQKQQREAQENAEMEARRQREANSKRKQELDQHREVRRRVLGEMDRWLAGSRDQGPELMKIFEAAKKSFEEILKGTELGVNGQTSNNSVVSTTGHIPDRRACATPQVKAASGLRVEVPASERNTSSIVSRYNVGFQPYLKSVTIPNLDRFRAHECAAEISHLFGSEVKHILQWLHLVKGVRKVLKLRVLDSRHQPHSEETVEDAIKALHVEELDWKRLDLSTRTVRDAAKTVHTLHLYASGSWTPIYHWVGRAGLDLLEGTSLRNLNITIIKDSESGLSQARILEQEKEVSESLIANGWKPEGQQAEQQHKQFCIRTSPWIIAGPPAPGNRDVAVVRDPRTVIRLSKFVPWYEKTHRKERSRRIRVAVLDSGIDQGQFEPNYDLDGQSFSGSHWWLSSEQHGTQMAKIITSIDPCCQLWIAKVADHRASITIEAVVKALQTAVENDVDIISMSFALNGQSQGLKNAVGDAHAKGIVLVCSTADEGENRTEAWPASYDKTLAIAACNDAGEKLVSSTTEAQYYFRGENVLYEPAARGSGGAGSGGAGSAEKISGSSVATAIAAGVASLCLACCEMDRVPVLPRERCQKVVNLFNKAKDKDGKYVRPWNLFGEVSRGDGDLMFLGG